MVVLRASLLGDIATLRFPAICGGHRGNRSEEDLEEREGFAHILAQSFGKVCEAPVTATGPGLRHLQLSLEEAFYLARIDERLELTVGRVTFPSALTTAALSLPLPRKRRLDAEQPRLPRQQDHHPHGGAADDNAGGAMTGCDIGVGDDVAADVNVSHIRGGTDADVLVDGDDAPSLSGEEAWRYCCNRRPDFPAMFAVYRHFRARRYTVHTGHKYGAHFVLYEGHPDECHSRYCVYVMGVGGGDSWAHMKTVTRLMPDVAKCLLVCGVRYRDSEQAESKKPLASQPADNLSLAALAQAEVTALRFSRARLPDGAGGRTSATTSDTKALPTAAKPGKGKRKA